MIDCAPGRPTASLGMYDFGAIAAANDALWRAMAGQLRVRGFAEVPDALDRRRPLPALWRDPALLVGQTCGFPLVHDLANHVVPVGTPVYAVPGCSGPSYRSALIARVDDSRRSVSAFSGAPVAVNSFDSQSGWNALAHAVGGQAGATVLGPVILTGGHAGSIHAVANGRADWAAIDAVTWHLIARHTPEAVAGVVRFGWTAAVPGLPLVTAGGRSTAEVGAIADAIAAALASPDTAPARAALGIAGVERLGFPAYEAVKAMARATSHLRTAVEKMTNINEVGNDQAIALGRP